jgi:hypothetical protein
MVPGNPSVGRKLIVTAIGIVLVMIVIAALVGMSKKTAPLKEPPLHPSMAIRTGPV